MLQWKALAASSIKNPWIVHRIILIAWSSSSARMPVAGQGRPDRLDDPGGSAEQRFGSRDDAHLLMQWDGSVEAGFTTGTLWPTVNLNYAKINAKAARTDPNSVFHRYRLLNALRLDATSHSVRADGVSMEGPAIGCGTVR